MLPKFIALALVESEPWCEWFAPSAVSISAGSVLSRVVDSSIIIPVVLK
jgi:hypothetical protein